jgi:biopolymer transport protein TolR
MAMNVSGGRSGLNADINVTPLVDVMLVLLIIMMLVAPLLQKGVNVVLPEAANTVDKPDQQEQTVVAVDSANRLWLNGLEVQKSEFVTRVKAALEDKTERIVLIRGDQDALYSAVMEAMDALREASIENIGLITEPPKEPARRPTGGM